MYIIVGLLYGKMSLDLPLGTASRMGPGYVPLLLSLVLALIGLAVVVRSLFAGKEAVFGQVPWRAVAFLSVAVVVFAGTLEGLGLLPVVFLTSLVASMASKELHFGKAVLVSAGLAILSTAIFAWGVRLPVPVLGPWFGY
ncbi:tripartite tricarboxylate transporter TctB family protein [Bosea sp. (in: a-proteobacteria)]|uniref:tripartite tricarboxylate transporter TctB family protein n=1 Tax=Bosea sp. (in: a-proteobacteria) TaxID=1871050 RepID=UPI00260D81B5|nr:tripartite tricarboxylate transporter TctB family protein [Bosea sp. (in: a-proteobacteria)]MCO5091341.1 CPP1-like family protein [Bosea sp. (in: a-proteobacteria)]